MKTTREAILRLMLIAERKRYLKLYNDAYPDVGMGPSDKMLQDEATEQIDTLIAERLK